MHEFALNAHSGLRYLILLLGLLIVVNALVRMPRKQPVEKAGLTMLRVWTILLDIQLVLGIIMIVTGRFYGQLMGHLVMMIAAVAVAHLGAVRLKKAEGPARSHGLLLAASAIPLVLMIAGIVAIGRSII